MKKGTILKLFLAINFYNIVWDVLEIASIIKISSESSFWFAWSIIITVALALLSTNKYWMGAFILDGVHRAARQLAARYTDAINSIFYQITTTSIIWLVIGVSCLSIASFFLYRLIKDQSFQFRPRPFLDVK